MRVLNGSSMSSSDKQLDESAISEDKARSLKIKFLFPNLKILPVTYGAENDTPVEG